MWGTDSLDLFLVVDLPDEPDGKQIDIHFVKEGNIDDTTRTSVKPEVSLLSFADSASGVPNIQSRF